MPRVLLFQHLPAWLIKEQQRQAGALIHVVTQTFHIWVQLRQIPIFLLVTKIKEEWMLLFCEKLVFNYWHKQLLGSQAALGYSTSSWESRENWAEHQHLFLSWHISLYGFTIQVFWQSSSPTVEVSGSLTIKADSLSDHQFVLLSLNEL